MATKTELEEKIQALEAENAILREMQAPETWPSMSWRIIQWFSQIWRKSKAFRLGVFIAVIAACIVGYFVWVWSRDKRQVNATPVPMLSIDDISKGIGLAAIWTGDFSDEENLRLRERIRNAKSIKFIAFNGDSFFQNFQPELEAFFNRSDAFIQVLFADPKDPFYAENTKFTLRRELSPAEVEDYQRHLQNAVSRLKSLERFPDQQVEIRIFKNQLRCPMIIVDNSFCVLTLRLPPFESKKSLRMEFVEVGGGFLEKCVTHFNQVWSFSRTTNRSVNGP